MKFSTILTVSFLGSLLLIAAPSFAGRGSPAYLEFNASQYTASSATSQAAVTVTRSNNLTEPVSVKYETSNGTAQAGVDYLATNGTLHFGVGETSQTFTVPVLKNQAKAVGKTVNLSLSAADYSGLIIRGTATLSVQ